MSEYEWDKYSQKTYRANFPDDDHEINGDITKIEAADIPALKMDRN